MRRIRAIFSAPYLGSWLSIHPKSSDQDAPFWIRFGKNGKSKGIENETCLQLMYPALTMRIKRIAKKAGIQKRVITTFSGIQVPLRNQKYLQQHRCVNSTAGRKDRRCARLTCISQEESGWYALKSIRHFKKMTTPKEKELTPIQCPSAVQWTELQASSAINAALHWILLQPYFDS